MYEFLINGRKSTREEFALMLDQEQFKELLDTGSVETLFDLFQIREVQL